MVISAALRWRHAPEFVAIIAITGLVTAFAIHYRKWRKGWLSYSIEQSMREMRKTNAAPEFNLRAATLRVRRIFHQLPHYSFLTTKIGLEYAAEDWRRAKLDQPAIISFFVMVVVLLAVLFLPHWPSRLNLIWHPLSWWAELTKDLVDKQSENVSHLFEGLIVVVIALIVFVAESIRSSSSADEKRVLLKTSKLWVLATLITLVPIAFIYPPMTKLFVALVLAMVLFTVWGFARVLMNLLDPDANLKGQRVLLRDRIRSIVLASARQRVGNKLLFDLLDGGSGGMQMVYSRSFLPGGSKNYVYIKSPRRGIIDDIDIVGLQRLGSLLANETRDTRGLSAPSDAGGETIGPEPDDDATATRKHDVPVPTLLRRFRETISEDVTFVDDFGIIAIPKVMVEGKPSLINEVNTSVATIFRFTKNEPPSTAFRNEMRSTKDRLLTAIQSGTLGEIEDLRGTYTLVAEEFLTTLNSLGGGYTADQARRERNDWFSSWDEVKWLTGDVRDLLKAAANTENADVVRAVLMLPSTIAVRAFQAGDNLLYQEFTSFSSYIYSLGVEQPPGTETRTVLIEKSHRYLAEILDFFIGPAMREGDEDGD